MKTPTYEYLAKSSAVMAQARRARAQAVRCMVALLQLCKRASNLQPRTA